MFDETKINKTQWDNLITEIKEINKNLVQANKELEEVLFWIKCEKQMEAKNG